MTDLALEPKPARKRKPRVSEDDDRRFTSQSTLAECKRLADVDVFTLDVAACAASHVASAWYSPEVATKPELIHGGCFGPDGLAGRWAGATWCNPPWSDIEAWVSKAWAEMARDAGPRVVAMLLPDDRREQTWWQALVEPHRDGRLSRVHGCTLETHTLAGLQRFGGTKGYGCALLVWRRLVK